jgi:hypothetical protein
MAMHKDIEFSLPLLSDPSDGIVEMLNDGILHYILDGEYFMAIYSTIDGDF